MLRRLGWAALLAGLPLVASGCNTASKQDQGEILIGVTLEKSGTGKALGDAEHKALEVTLDKVNKDGVLGRKVRLLVNDNKSDPVEAVKQVTALADDQKVVAIIGPGTTPTTLPVLPTIEQKRIPHISMGASDAITEPVDKHRHTFRTPVAGRAFVEVMAREFGGLGIKKIGLLAVNNKFGDNGVAAVAAVAKLTGMQIVASERFAETDKDYSTQVGRLVQAKPEAILVSAIMPGAGIVAKNIREAGFNGRVYFDGGAGAELFVKGAGQSAENMFMITNTIMAANHITATTPSMLAQKEFFAEYTQRYGDFSGYASYAADALNLLVEAIKKANSTDRQQVRDALETLEYDGLTGTFRFSPTNHGGASADGLTVLTVQKGGWVLAP